MKRRNVQPLARKIFEALRDEKRSIELILVDDRSTDETWQEILTARRADSRIRALRHQTQSGQSAALWTGFQASRGEVIATLDGDLQNDPADLPRMLAQLATCDMVCGVRVGRKDTAVRRLSSVIARLARKIVLGVDFRDSGCNLRVFKRSVLKLLPAVRRPPPLRADPRSWRRGGRQGNARHPPPARRRPLQVRHPKPPRAGHLDSGVGAKVPERTKARHQAA